MSAVLVTGGSGFIGGHIILALLEAGHEVRATLRDIGREGEVRAMLVAAGAKAPERFSCHVADLLDDAGWAEAVTGCDYVLHVASPFPAGIPQDENALIAPAREGTLRVLRQARAAGVKRVVVTSSFGAIGYGHGRLGRPFDENDWTVLGEADVQPYMKSKTLAERAAWDFVAAEGGIELAVINPVGVFGPVLGPDLSTSTMLIKHLLDGALPAVPRIYFNLVDARDVAELHLRAMVDPAAAGERFLAVAGDCLPLHEVARILRRNLGTAASRVPRYQLPDWVVRLVALGNPAARAALPQLGIIRGANGDKARRLLGWRPRSNEEALVATGESLIRLGLVGREAGRTR
ncbi:aldehyde reductase [Bosea sp. LjRoot90]|uniref:SDR family oxidoreductase n=1 Tax=Bosea sp. LjRoot90 TaxID=3342342 RepID=UPI003ECD1F53